MQVQELVSERLQNLLPPGWLETEDGRVFLKRQELKLTWAQFIGTYPFDSFGTLTFRDSVGSSVLAIDRTKRLLRKCCKEVGIECNAFVVAEPHKSGFWHTHILMRVGALSKEHQRIILSYFWKTGFEGELYGRNSFKPIENQEASSLYCAKYVAVNSLSRMV